MRLFVMMLISKGSPLHARKLHVLWKWHVWCLLARYTHDLPRYQTFSGRSQQNQKSFCCPKKSGDRSSVPCILCSRSNTGFTNDEVPSVCTLQTNAYMAYLQAEHVYIYIYIYIYIHIHTIIHTYVGPQEPTSPGAGASRFRSA